MYISTKVLELHIADDVRTSCSGNCRDLEEALQYVDVIQHQKAIRICTFALLHIPIALTHSRIPFPKDTHQMQGGMVLHNGLGSF